MLTRTCDSLPAAWYFDPDQFRREMESIWWREWLCVGRASECPDPGSYRLVSVGNQQIILTRTAAGELKAFHNTCRHRGSVLCQAESGQFDHERIVCPYHSWTYSLEGELLRTPYKADSEDFDPANYPLYRVALETWGGFVFINLAEQPETSLAAALGEDLAVVAHWPLAELALAHREVHTLACNWKVFWENYLECYHCPKVHQDLCRLVPLYGQALVGNADAPAGSPEHVEPGRSRLAPGAVTWSHDGQTTLPWFDGLTEDERSVGMTFANAMPGAFIVAHVDYVRSVHVMPLGPEQTRLTVNWMLQPETLEHGAVDIPALIAFGNQVVAEDAVVCELNQRGLRSQRHRHGVLVPQEYDLLAFHDWLRARLDRKHA